VDILSLKLSLEQEFALRTYQEQVKALSQEAAQAYLLEACRQLMVKDNAIRSLVKSGAGLDESLRV
jgi:hypothetical protein